MIMIPMTRTMTATTTNVMMMMTMKTAESVRAPASPSKAQSLEFYCCVF